MEKRVAIIGAGISGLLACKYTASKGFTPVVFEVQDQVGGLWNHTLESTRLQTFKDFFQFSDFPWPSSVQEMFPQNSKVLEYLQSYAHHFELLPYIKFNSKVMSIDYVGESEEEMKAWELWGGVGKAFGSKGKWNITVHDTKEDSIKEYVAEFVVICNGRFSGLPNIPEFPLGQGPEVFSGKVLHSMDYSAMDNKAAAVFVKGKRVAVLGSGKSAIDIVSECADANGKDHPCTLVHRTVHWMLPDGQPWGVNFGLLCFTRFVELLVHKPGEGFLSNLVTSLLSPMRWMINKFVESYARCTLPLKKHGMIPKESFLQELASCQITLLVENFFDKVEDGSIVLKKSQNFSFCKEGLVVDGDDNNPVKADIVIFATGYKGDEKLKHMFASPTFQKWIAGSPNSTIPLYRQIINPRIPQLAVIGYSESISNLYTFEMRCKWLSYFLDQTFHLPSIKEMEEDNKKWDKYMKKYSGNGKFRHSCIGGVPVWYNDQLCKDMGCNPRRKKGFFTDLFQPYGLFDYDEV